MGQYRQWLYYREIDQKLQAQLEILEQELTQFKEQARVLSSNDYSTDNAILQALSRQQRAEEHYSPIHEAPASVHNVGITESVPADSIYALQETISPALFGWSQLPNFDAQELQIATPKAKMLREVPPTPRVEDLQPEDVTAFVDEQKHTIPPQIKLPWWFNDTLSITRGPIDQQSLRTNHLVQRWLERWRKPSQISQETQKDHVR